MGDERQGPIKDESKIFDLIHWGRGGASSIPLARPERWETRHSYRGPGRLGEIRRRSIFSIRSPHHLPCPGQLCSCPLSSVSLGQQAIH